MVIKTIVVGHLATNCYIVENDSEAIIIDPGDEPEKIEKALSHKLIGIIITHSHSDHISGMNYFIDKYSVPVYNFDNLKEGPHKLGKFTFDIIYTPGHTSDSLSIYFKKGNILFSGDFIFYNTIGRTDLGGNIEEMKKSIHKIKKYDNMYIYPGHGIKTTLEIEKEHNVYFR